MSGGILLVNIATLDQLGIQLDLNSHNSATCKLGHTVLWYYLLTEPSTHEAAIIIVLRFAGKLYS